MSIPGKLLLASSDLNARARVLQAACDREIAFTGPRGFAGQLAGVEILVLDLDEGGPQALEELLAARSAGLAPPKVLGFMSHVDRDLGFAAREAGCRAVARGRFWSQLAEVLEANDPTS